MKCVPLNVDKKLQSATCFVRLPTLSFTVVRTHRMQQIIGTDSQIKHMTRRNPRWVVVVISRTRRRNPQTGSAETGLIHLLQAGHVARSSRS